MLVSCAAEHTISSEKKDFRELLRIAISGLYADYAVNLECITHVSNTKIGVTRAHTISEKERHPGTAADSISGIYAANNIAFQCVMIQTHSYQSTPLGFAYRVPRPHCRRPDYYLWLSQVRPHLSGGGTACLFLLANRDARPPV